MNAEDRARIGNRIVIYLGKRLAVARMWNEQTSLPEARLAVANAEVLLDAFIVDPMEVGEADCDETHSENLRYCATLTPQKKLVVALLIERAADRWENQFRAEVE